MQFRENGHVSVDSTDFGTKHESQQLHRLASMRHYQALIQNKPGNGQNEVSVYAATSSAAVWAIK